MPIFRNEMNLIFDLTKYQVLLYGSADFGENEEAILYDNEDVSGSRNDGSDHALRCMSYLSTTLLEALHKVKILEQDYLRSEYLEQLIYSSDLACFEQLRMDRYTFKILCGMLGSTDRIKDTSNMKVDEQVAMFLHIIAHHVKNRVIKFRFIRSGETISRHFNALLNAVIRLQGQLLKKPKPVLENSTDDRWKWFKVLYIRKFKVHI